MASQLVDPFGYPVSSGGSGRLLDATRPDSKRRPSWETRVESIHKSVGWLDWKTLLSASRRLVSNFPVLEGAAAAKAMHAVGRAWEPIFLGEDQAWGEIAKAWLRDEWFQICDTEGENYDWKTSLYLNSMAIDQDGDFAVILTQTEAGYPKLQHIAADRIGQRVGSQGVVGPSDAVSIIQNEDGTTRQVRGLYAGFRIELGVIFNQYGTPIAFRVLGETQAEDQDIAARDLILRFDPRARRQARGLPAFSGAIEFLASSFEAHDGESRALLASSFISLLEWNESGAADGNDPGTLLGNTTSGEQALTQKQLEKGSMIHYKAGTGSKLEAFASQRPGESWESFQDRIIRIALAPVWPYSLIWKPDGMNGTQERSAIESARNFVADRQDLLLPVARREVNFGISKAINLKRLPPYPGKDLGGQLKWGFEMPPEFNIDHGREDQQERENYRMGLSTLQRYLSRNSRGTVRDHWRQRAREEAEKQIAIAEIEKEYGVTIDPRHVQMLNPNEMAQKDAGDQQDEPQKKNDK